MDPSLTPTPICSALCPRAHSRDPGHGADHRHRSHASGQRAPGARRSVAAGRCPAPEGYCLPSLPALPSAHCWCGRLSIAISLQGMAMIGVSMAGLALCGGHALFFLFLLFGTGLGLAMTANSVLTGYRYPERRATMLTLLNFSWSAGAAVSPFAVQFVIHHAGIGGLFWCMAAAGGLSTLLALFLRDERGSAAQDIGLQVSASHVQSSRRRRRLLRYLRIALLRDGSRTGWLGTYICPPAPLPDLRGASARGIVLLAFPACRPRRGACSAPARAGGAASRRRSHLRPRRRGGVAHAALARRRSCFPRRWPASAWLPSSPSASPSSWR